MTFHQRVALAGLILVMISLLIDIAGMSRWLLLPNLITAILFCMKGIEQP